MVALLAAGFTELLDDVLEGELDTYVDQPVGQWFAANRDAWLTGVMKVLTHVGDPLSLVAIVVSVSAWVCWRIRSWAPALLGGLSGLIGVGGVVLVVAKWMVGRNRPPSWTAVIVEDGFSFPSGHATGGFAVAVLLAWMAGSVIRGWTARVKLWAFALTAAGVVAFSRVYLGVHYVSDVAAGGFPRCRVGGRGSSSWGGSGGRAADGQRWRHHRRVDGCNAKTRLANGNTGIRYTANGIRAPATNTLPNVSNAMTAPNAIR